MPVSPSCAWLLSENDLRIELALLRADLQDQDCLDHAKLLVHGHREAIEAAFDDYGDALGISHDDLKWALGHVHSRAYGEECSLIPIVDLINHHPAAMPPLG